MIGMLAETARGGLRGGRRLAFGVQLTLIAAGVAVGIYVASLGETLVDLNTVFADGDIPAEAYTEAVCAEMTDRLRLNPNAYAGPPTPLTARFYFARDAAHYGDRCLQPDPG